MMNNVTTLPGASDQPIKQHQPDFSAAGFGRRPTAGLDALKVPESERATKVAEAAGVTIRTARRYLKGTSQPRGVFSQMTLADALGLMPMWLVFEEDCPKTKAEDEELRRFVEAYRKNPPWRKRLIDRTLTRMANKSPRVERLMDLRDKGQLSADDFLRLAGR